LPIFHPTKIAAFQNELKNKIQNGAIKNEFQVIRHCFEHGVRRKHAEPVLADMKKDDLIDCSFRVPDINRIKDPRDVILL
jgi:hypothetical protein